MRLIAAETLAAKIPLFDALRAELPVPAQVRRPLDAPQDDRLLTFYLLLTYAPHLLGDGNGSEEDVFWSRYYWFQRYVEAREAACGYDAGLRQQAFQILEHPPAGVDWSFVERVDGRVKDDAAQYRAELTETTERG